MTRPRLLFLFAVALTVLAIPSGLAVPSDAFPYLATVSANPGTVRCGPGLEYYATDELPAGAAVEVYRHDAEGWLAIRPPDGSFSWVDRDKLEMQGAQLATVLTADAVVWVGTRIGRVTDHKWQVRLERGETVEVLGERSMSLHAETGRQALVQISPPSGEFRWVHASDVVRGGGATKSDQIRLVSREVQAATSDRAESHEQLRRLNLKLSRIVSQDIDSWDFDALLNEIDGIDGESTSTAARRNVNELVNTIEQFVDLRRRHTELHRGGAGQPGDSDEPVGSGLLPATDSSAEVLDGGDTGFAGQGWLMPVYSTRFTAPPFALLDDNGKVLFYVSPAPGFNLHRYQKKRVGVVGQSAYAQQLKANHLTAERVVLLR